MVNTKAVLGLFGKGLAVVLAALVVTSGVVGGLVAGGVVEVGQPTVEDVRTEWGTVNEDRSEIEATVELNNPNPVGVPALIDMRYELQMNDVTVGEGEETGVGIDSGRDELTFEADIDNDEVTDWWVSHINNGERTDITISAEVDAPGVSRTFRVNRDPIETDFLSGLETDGGQTVEVRGREVAVVESTSVEWGEADQQTTPVKVSVTVRNTGSEPVEIRDFGYAVRFNQVNLGDGVDDTSYTIQPGETKTIEFTMNLRTEQIEVWWPTHVQSTANTEVEQTRVQTSGFVVVESNGISERVSLEAMDTTTVFNTEIIASDDEGS